METNQLKGERRTSVGTRDSRSARAAGRLPAIIYGHGADPEPITLGAHDLDVALRHGARMLDVELAGKTAPYLIKAVQYDHLATTPIHLDLVRVDLDEKVQVQVGIELKGTPVGSQDGGIVDQMMADLAVECIISAIPDTLHPTITHLKVGDSLLVKDIELPPDVVVMSDPEARVATVRLSAAAIDDDEAEATVEDEAEEKTDEPERIGRVRKEEEGKASK